MIVTLRRTLAPFAARAGAAVAAGYLLYLSFPPREWWFLAPLAIAALLITLRGRSIRAAVVLGYLAGLGFFVPLLPWVGEYVGPVPWLALSAAQAVAFAVFAACVPLLHSCRGAPIWIASAWVAVEAARSRLPFGGFPWGRIGFGQADGPLLSIAALGGAPGLSFVVVAMGSAIALAAAGVRTRQWHALALLVVIGISVAVVSVVPLSSGGGDRQISVALIQGNVPRLGLDFNAQRRAVLDNHVRKTLELANMIALGKSARPDFVLWPENSSDIDPYRNDDAFDQISTAARVIGVPIVVGAVIRSADGTTRNSSIVWDPKTGPGQTHDKRKLVPFGEYLPMRDLMIRLSSYAEKAGNFVAGSGNGVVEIGDVPTAVTTCYEVAFDGLVTQSVRAGAQLITVPTNNATFGRTEMTYQQLAMSRVRAVEHNRAVLIAATSGVSAVVDRDGTVVQRSGLFTANVLMARVALSSDLTVATRIGTVPEWLAVTVVVAFLAGAACRHRTRRKLP